MPSVATAEILDEAATPRVEFSVVQERSALEQALDSMLQARGADDLRFVALGPDDGERWCFGAALRMTSDDGQVQDFALFATRGCAQVFVRWLFGFSAKATLDDAALLDAIGETLTQLVGRIKEIWIASHGIEPVLDVPKLLGPEACDLYLAMNAESLRTEVTGTPWRRGLQAVVSKLQDPALCALDEVLGLLACAGDDRAVLSRAQAGIANVREHLIGDARTSAEDLLSWCTEQIVAMINGASRDCAHIEHALCSLREQVASACRRHDFEIPEDTDLVALLGEFVEEAQTVLAGAQAELDRPGPMRPHGPFRAMHTIKGNAGFFGLEQMQRLAHSTENMLAQVRDRDAPLDEAQVRATRRSVALLQDFATRTAERIESGGKVPYQRAIDLHRAVIDAAVAGGTSPVVDDWAPTHSSSARQEAPMLRVSSEHIESVEAVEHALAAFLVGLPDRDARFHESGLRGELAALHEKLASACRSLRRVSLERLFGKLRRLCSETAEHLGKLVQVELSGDHLDVPRHLVTALSGPMVHLARNAIDHGIEDPEQRRTTSKPLLATVACRASRRGGWLVIELTDDGRGVDPERVRAKAVRLGIIAEDTELTQEGILELLMAPGFSTAEKTTDISGRGVGLDVVRKEIESVGGRIELSSTLGGGSTFRILLPEDPNAIEDTPVDEAEPDDIDLGDSGELTFL